MEKVVGSITEDMGDYKVENMLFTYSEEEKQENEINKMNANLVLKPKFIPVYPSMLQDLSLVEGCLYGFIDFFLSNNEKCFISNKQFAELLNVSEGTISSAIKNLESKGYIVLTKKMKAGGGLIRFINLPKCKKSDYQNAKNEFTKNEKLHNIYNNNIENNNIENKIIENKLSEQVATPKQEVLLDEKQQKKEQMTKEINELIERIKSKCFELGEPYDKTKERMYARNILVGVDLGAFCEQLGISRVDYALGIIVASQKISYWKGVCNGPMKIYLNHSEVFSKAKLKGMQQQSKAPVVMVVPKVNIDDTKQQEERERKRKERVEEQKAKGYKVSF